MTSLLDLRTTVTRLIREHHGTLHSPMTNILNKIEISCERGHRWKDYPIHVAKGQWCLSCEDPSEISPLEALLTEMDVDFVKNFSFPDDPLVFPFQVRAEEDTVLCYLDGICENDIDHAIELTLEHSTRIAFFPRSAIRNESFKSFLCDSLFSEEVIALWSDNLFRAPLSPGLGSLEDNEEDPTVDEFSSIPPR